MTQNEWVLNALKQGPLTALDALRGCGCFRLAARVNDLRNLGYNIQSATVHKGDKIFSQYRLVRSKK